MSVREELEKLSLLQQLDLQIDKAKKVKNLAPNAFAELEKQLASENIQLKAVDAQVEETEKQKRNLESEMAMDGDRIKNIEGRLGTVSNNKEFHAANKEVEKAKKTNTDRTKTIADLAEKAAVQKALQAEIQARIAALNESIEKRKTEVGSQVQDADNEIAKITSDRTSAAAAVNPALMSTYNRIRTRHADALVAVKSGGWQLLGQTPLKIFDKEKTAPCFFKTGDNVRFVSISKKEFEKLNEY
jgi:predicted  nucleic acid-binding Zn-ribbon protein